MERFETTIHDAAVIKLNPINDERGHFVEIWHQQKLEELGITIPPWKQVNCSFNKEAGTLRGMHYQTEPHAEDKLIQCLKGKVYDVIIDIRPESPTYMKWFGVELSEDDFQLLYVPKGCAHGFQTLTDNAKVLYHVSEFYAPNNTAGILYNDPAFNIPWPVTVSSISERDLSHSLFEVKTPVKT